MSEAPSRLARLTPAQRLALARALRERAERDAGRLTRADYPTSHEEGLDGDDVRRFYDTVNRQLDRGPFAQHSMFLNYGYIANDGPSASRVALPAGVVNRNCIKLVLELVGDLELAADADVLDVGCGRGGTIWTLRNYFVFNRARGVDLSPAAVEYCARRHGDDRTTFQVGTALELPLGDASVDVVTNVESSHCYTDLGRFYAEVRRVLRPGGYFLYTDLLPAEQLAGIEATLAGLGFEMQRCHDVTSNVILSCDETAARNARAFLSGNDDDVMARFLGMPDSVAYEAMKNQTRRYVMYRFQLPARGT